MATASGGESWHSPTVPLSAEQLADPTGAGETANHSASHVRFGGLCEGSKTEDWPNKFLCLKQLGWCAQATPSSLAS